MFKNNLPTPSEPPYAVISELALHWDGHNYNLVAIHVLPSAYICTTFALPQHFLPAHLPETLQSQPSFSTLMQWLVSTR